MDQQDIDDLISFLTDSLARMEVSALGQRLSTKYILIIRKVRRTSYTTSHCVHMICPLQERLASRNLIHQSFRAIHLHNVRTS
ncbi:MAG: hypothetical protein IPJ06_19580 [Saprospiraceae bacterium]|nr:hypothetical protein [Saprospiraceae bacterium]